MRTFLAIQRLDASTFRACRILHAPVVIAASVGSTWTYNKIIRWHHVSIFWGTGKERGYRTLCRSLCQARARTLYRILARPHSLALALVLCHTHADAHNLAQLRLFSLLTTIAMDV